jgi:hypothetical protein
VPSHDFGLFDASTGGEVRRFGLGDLARPWKGFTDLWLMADMAMVLSLAVLLGAVIAYHPTSRSKASSLEELEQPKTFIMYAMVGAVIGVVVSIYPVMGPVIFGIGGLLRFRTNVGPAKDTGRVILAVIVGVSAGLKLMVVAVFATACGWLLIWVLERQPFGRLQVRGLVPANIPRSAEAYRKILVAPGAAWWASASATPRAWSASCSWRRAASTARPSSSTSTRPWPRTSAASSTGKWPDLHGRTVTMVPSSWKCPVAWLVAKGSAPGIMCTPISSSV